MRGLIMSQQHKRNLSTRQNPPITHRFIIIGASIMYSTFLDEAAIVSLINAAYPEALVEVHNEAVSGSTTAYSAAHIDEYLANYSDDNVVTKTYVLIHTGGNDVTNNRPYSSDSNISDMEDDYNYILDAIIDKGFTPILNEISFRNYDETTLDNEENGSLPYNENIIKPLNLSRELGFIFEDGTSYWQLYNAVYNNPSWLNADDIHINNLSAIRNLFVSTICQFIFTGVPPTKLIKE